MKSLKESMRGDMEFRKPSAGDAVSVYEIVKKSGVLDENSLYSYLLLCTHFSETSIVACSGDEITGFITAYLVPGWSECLFIWQVAVKEEFRGQGLAYTMAENLLKRSRLKSVTRIEATVTPSNTASKSFFRGLAKKLKTACHESLFFEKSHFAGMDHEEEYLFSIGPFVA